jgi:predicted ATPase
MRQGLTDARATGAELGQPACLALLAEMQGQVGQIEAGLRVLAEAVVAVERTEERFYEAELHRLQGELLLQQAVADQQQAKSLELRIAMSLSRLWQQQGKRAEARELLAPIYA